MLDKIVIVNSNLAYLVYTDKPTKTISTDVGDIVSFIQWFLSSSQKDLTEYTQAYNNGFETTNKIAA